MQSRWRVGTQLKKRPNGEPRRGLSAWTWRGTPLPSTCSRSGLTARSLTWMQLQGWQPSLAQGFQVEAGQAPPEPTPAEQGTTATVTPFLAPEEPSGQEPFLAPDRQCPQSQPEGQVQYPMPSAGGTLKIKPEGEDPTDQEETPFLRPAEITHQEPAAHPEQETPYVGPFQQALREYTSSEEEPGGKTPEASAPTSGMHRGV